METLANNRLQPCLFDRLCDDEPEKTVESRSQRIISLARFKEGVLRDLSWLFNSSSHVSGELIGADERVRTSVVNFGVRDLSGLVSDSVDLESYRLQVRDALLAFEPRLNRNKLELKLSRGGGDGSAENRLGTLRFEISGELWARPMPERFYARTDLDLETGQCVVF